jgi:hypothetical protein
MLGMLLTPAINMFAAGCSKPTFLGLIPWYQYLQLSSDAAGHCAVTDFNPGGTSQRFVLGSHSSFLLIALALLDDVLRIAAFVSVGYVIYGGITYITSQGSPDQTKKAQSTIINALIGLAIALLSASVVAFIGNKLG